jgi:hypothetical protein
MTCRVLEHVIKIPILSISEIRIFHLFFKDNINIMVKPWEQYSQHWNTDHYLFLIYRNIIIWYILYMFTCGCITIKLLKNKWRKSACVRTRMSREIHARWTRDSKQAYLITWIFCQLNYGIGKEHFVNKQTPYMCYFLKLFNMIISSPQHFADSLFINKILEKFEILKMLFKN